MHHPILTLVITPTIFQLHIPQNAKIRNGDAGNFRVRHRSSNGPGAGTVQIGSGCSLYHVMPG